MPLRRVAIIVAALVAWTASAADAAAADLTVTVTNLRSGDGNVHYAVYDDPDGFPSAGRWRTGGVVPAANDQVTTVISGLPAGRYALAVYHDENANGSFDQWLFGLPLEGFGFSRDAPARFGPPKFDDAAIDLPETGAEITIRMRY